MNDRVLKIPGNSSSTIQSVDSVRSSTKTNVFCNQKIVYCSSKSIFFLIVVFIVIAALPGQSCYGCLPGIQYHYEYESLMILNNDDNLEPAGFKINGQVFLENIWQNNDGYLAMIQLDQFRFQPRDSKRFHSGYSEAFIDDWPPVLVQINRHGQIQNLFVEKKSADNNKKLHHLVEPTHLNLVVSILNALRNHRDPDEKLTYDWIQNGRTLIRRSKQEDSVSKYSLLAPLITDVWHIQSQMANDHDISETINGWQNVTLESKIYPNGHSKLFVEFGMKLSSEGKKTEIQSKLSKATTIPQAVHLFGSLIQSKPMVSLGPAHFHAERKPCLPHFCKSLPEFMDEYQKSLSEDHSLATNQISVAYLRLLNYIRINSAQITRKDVSKLLLKYDQSRNQDGDVFSTIMDTIAASRHGEALLAALDHLNLVKCHGDDRVADCERFLATITISGSTVANMGSSYVAEHSLSVEQLLDVLLPLLVEKSPETSDSRWADDRVRHSFAMTIATLLNSYQSFTQMLSDQHQQAPDHVNYESSRLNLRYHSSPTWFVDVSADQENLPDQSSKPDVKARNNLKHHQQKLSTISEKIIKHLQQELDSCKDADCRIVYLHALGNTRIISKHGMLNTLKKYATDSGKRESVASMKAMRECVQFESRIDNLWTNDKLVKRLRQLLIRIVYDSSLETTSRLIASELLANYIDPDGDITIELVQHLDKFPSELATMIWKRAVKNVISRRGGNSTKSSDNWHLQSKILSGSSASFRYVMGGTEHANASYGVFLELLKAKLPKETYFNVDISRGDITQDIISVGLFARGLQSFAGDSTDDENDSSNNEINDESQEESTLAGMHLQVLGNQLRPFLFFRSTSELMGHLWSGAASEPTSVFRANLLLADYLDVKPLINGFLVEQSLKGVFSLDLNGEVQVSLWNRNSHSNVQTNGAILFQGSQEIFATQRKTSAKNMFSFGAESKLNFITDFDFYSSPYRICIQITQPEFVFRHNTRKYEQINSDDLHRRIHRRSLKIPAKSYVLNRDNSEMCAIMNGDSTANNGQAVEFD